MADAGVSHTIFFVASIAMAAAVSGVLFQSVAAVTDSISWKGRELQEDLRSDIEIVNDPKKVSNNPTKIYVKNTGSSILHKDELSVLLDGVYTSVTTSLLGGATAWKPTETVEVSISGVQAVGDHRVRVIARTGAAEDFGWTV